VEDYIYNSFSVKTVNTFYRNGGAIVNLKCDPTRKRIEDAKFEVINDNHNPRVSQVWENIFILLV